MNQVEYTLLVQKIFLIATSVSFFGISLMLVFLDPYSNPNYVWGFLILLLVMLAGIVTLVMFWWYFKIRKKILSIYQVNTIIYQSIITSTIAVTLMVLNQTNQLNPLTVGIVLGLYSLYWVWSAAENTDQ